MYIRARFECKSVKRLIPQGSEKVRCEIVMRAHDICEGDNANWSPDSDPDGHILMMITDPDLAKQFEPGKRYALCLVGCDKQGTWRHFLDLFCNFAKRRQESSSAWSRFIIWLTPAVPFVSSIWIATGLHVL